MKAKILASIMVAVFAWTVCDVGEAKADLEDIPSTGEFVMMGVAAAAVITAIIVMAVKSGDDTQAQDIELAVKTEEENLVREIEPAAKVELRIDPVLTLQKNGMGAGLAFSF